VINDASLKLLGDIANRRRLLVNMPMDMDYAHYRGYEGKTIYEIVDGKPAYWDTATGKYQAVGVKDFLKSDSYFQQIVDTQTAFGNSGGQLISFYHYDPRRWQNQWDAPFHYLAGFGDAAACKKFTAAGFKMYTALGYRPDDPKLPTLWDFYARCAKLDVPILCHGTKHGLTPADIGAYYDADHPGDAHATNAIKENYFYETFISPMAWEKVLKRNPSLRLCLAHLFGHDEWASMRPAGPAAVTAAKPGSDNWVADLLRMLKTYPNLYVDISYSPLEQNHIDQFKEVLRFDPSVKERILFGTDWYLMTQESEFGSAIPLPFVQKKGYREYFADTYNRILQIGDQAFCESIGLTKAQDLLAYFLVLNPLRFLRLKDSAPAIKAAHHAVSSGAAFELGEWLGSVPETIDGFYK
jgi:hypothetical protein